MQTNIKTIPFSVPYFSNEEYESLKSPISTGWVSQGKEVELFENTLKEICQADYVIAVNSCTSALHLSLIAHSIGPGDEVICPSYSFIATANSIKHAGATPVFTDVDIHTSNMTPQLTEKCITKRTKAIMVVHQFGASADIQGFRNLANKYNLLLIQDSACSLGSTYKNKSLSTFGNISCLSFHPRKIITTGEGGAILTNDKSIAQQLRELRSHGASISDAERHKAGGVIYENYNLIGYNYRMSDLHAAVGNIQLKKLDEIIGKRKTIAEKYLSAFKNLKEEVGLPEYLNDSKPNFQSFQIRVLKGEEKRDKLILNLVKDGISCRRGIPPTHLENAYYSQPFYKSINLPNTLQLSQEGLLLPIFPSLKIEDQEYIINRIKDLLEKL